MEEKLPKPKPRTSKEVGPPDFMTEFMPMISIFSSLIMIVLLNEVVGQQQVQTGYSAASYYEAQLVQASQERRTAAEYDSRNNPIYIGEASVGTTSYNTAIWKIKRIMYDENSNPILVQWAEGNQRYDKIWDKRASYDYS